MTRRIIDISMPLENEVISDPLPYNPKITCFNHHQSYEQMAPFFPGLKKEDLPDGEAWAVEMVQLITHNGAHLDAPWRFASTMNRGERAITIDEVPLDWRLQPGVKLDFRHFDDGYVVTADDVARELDRIGHALRPLDIVVVNTRAGSAYGGGDYVDAGCGMGYDATMRLPERGVRLIRTDAWSATSAGAAASTPFGASGSSANRLHAAGARAKVPSRERRPPHARTAADDREPALDTELQTRPEADGFGRVARHSRRQRRRQVYRRPRPRTGSHWSVERVRYSSGLVPLAPGRP